ncbi:MAG TPA: YfiR family protein, partial [Tepidisphaeraceae bacterium]|nr:YfiR family protein [Tepidisphaeraceae bacterium]
MLIAIFATYAVAENAPSRESQVKAAMICNFVQFVEWPSDAFSSADAPLVIGVMNPNPFGDVVEQLTRGKSLNGHAIVIRHLDSADEVQGCHAIFVPATREADLNAIMHKASEQPMLTIGETDSFPWAGGILRFYLEENKLRFEVNPEAAAHARLQISSKLMKLATIFKR